MALPAPTPITTPSPYFVAGTTKYSWVTAIANPASPTSAELTAGTALEFAISAVAGFDTTAAEVAIPNAGTRYVSNIPGRITSQTSSITFYSSLSAADVRSIFTLDLNGFIVRYPEGIVSGGKMDVFTVRVASVSRDPNIEAAGMQIVTFSIYSQPLQNLAIPTS